MSATEQDQDLTLTQPQELRGRAAYSRYCNRVKKTYDGRPLLTWEQLPPLIQLGWADAGTVDEAHLVHALNITFESQERLIVRKSDIEEAGGWEAWAKDNLSEDDKIESKVEELWDAAELAELPEFGSY